MATQAYPYVHLEKLEDPKDPYTEYAEVRCKQALRLRLRIYERLLAGSRLHNATRRHK